MGVAATLPEFSEWTLPSFFKQCDHTLFWQVAILVCCDHTLRRNSLYHNCHWILPSVHFKMKVYGSQSLHTLFTPVNVVKRF